MTKPTSLSRYRFLLRATLIGVGALLLLWTPALNGYPFLYSDSGTYMDSGAFMYVPLDRSIGYGVFLYRINLVPSLWSVVALQVLGLCYLMFRAAELLNKALPGRLRPWVAFVVVVLTALTTTVSTFVGFISPDIFTSWLFLGAPIFFLTTHRFERILSAAFITLALWVHNGNLILGGGMMLILVLALFFSPRWRARFALRIVALCGVFALTLTGIITINAYLHAGLALSRGGTTILLNRLVAAGVVGRTLTAYCGEQRWLLCDFQSQLSAPHDQPDWFLWGADSPIVKVGWDKNEQEQRDIIWHSFQCCAAQIVTSSAAESWRQIWLVSSGSHIVSLGDEWNAVKALHRYFPNQVSTFEHSVQQGTNKPLLSLLPFDETVSQFLFLFLLAVLLATVNYSKEFLLSFTIAALLLFLVMNAVLVGSINGASGRYQARIIWLVPYMTYVAGAYLLSRFAARKSAPSSTCKLQGDHASTLDRL